ncbi:DUF5606 family protein [Chitinophaga japonensis]|uniref:Uncharacterized protein n=1 Tax=Chitinophaga japonensis TaxID=104662 RepID=A0A562TE11_CHIJA|nr:DUF5606 domain-containing protein [Chitinophaga japonensis]TWI91518.1 hypothetical protein LX66_0887 [Chitinophaga japonensis]
MQYREIVAVTGLGGLFQLIASKQDGAIVRSLEDKSTRFVSSRVHNFTPLESIEVFTTGDNVNLAAVFKAMQEKETEFPLADARDNNAIKAYFRNVYPTFDEEKVYVSDMKKMVKWYAILKANDLLKFDEILADGEEAAEAAETPAAEPAAEQPAAEAEKPAKKAKAPKAAAKEATAADAGDAPAEKPAKKTRAKKEEAPEGEAAPKKTTRKKKTEE